jgi:hypothetical protein
MNFLQELFQKDFDMCSQRWNKKNVVPLFFSHVRLLGAAIVTNGPVEIIMSNMQILEKSISPNEICSILAEHNLQPHKIAPVEDLLSEKSSFNYAIQARFCGALILACLNSEETIPKEMLKRNLDNVVDRLRVITLLRIRNFDEKLVDIIRVSGDVFAAPEVETEQ